MKNSLRPFILFWVAFVGLLGLSMVSNAQQFYTLTYSQGDIGGPANYTTATPTTCPGILTFNNIPLGMRVDSVQVSYDFFTSMAGFGNPGMQRSYLRCPTRGVDETQLTSPAGSAVGTTNSYARTVSIANGVVTGPLTLELHGGSADPLSFSSCGSSTNSILNNTWTVRVYVSSGIPTFVPTTGLIAYYPFNGSPNDATSGNSHMTPYGGISPTSDRTNTPNMAYGFDGIDDYLVDTPSFTMSQTGSFSYSVWIKKDSLVGLTLMHGNSTTGNFVTLIGGSSQVQFGTNQQGSAWIWANANVTLGAWDHYACTYNGTTKAMQIFKNGQLAGTATYTYTAAVAAVQPLFVGRGIGGAGTYFKGKIDDIGIWNRTLTNQEIIALYTGGGRDARIQAITAPTSLVQGNNQLTVRIQNSGSDTLMSAQLSYQIGQGTPVTVSHTFSPPLAPTDTLLYTFATPFSPTSGSNTTQMTAWISNTNGMGSDLNPGNDTATASACVGLTGNYTVGSNGDFASISAAITQLTTCGMAGPVTLNLLPGVHSGTSVVPSYTGSIHGLTIQSSTGNRDDVLLTNGSTIGHVLFLNNSQNVTLRNLSVRLQYPSTAPSAQISALNIDGGSGITIENCSFVADSLATSTFNRNISVVNSNNLLVQNCTIREGYYGLYHTGATSPNYAQNNRFLNNTFNNQYFYGAYFLRMGGIEFKGNRINSARTGTGSTTSSYALRLDNCKGLDVSGNQIAGTFGSYGIYLSNCQMDTINNRPSRLYNNVLSIDFTNTTAPRALFLALSATDGLDALEVAHNSFEVRSALTSATNAGVVTLSGSTSTTVTNTLAYFGFSNNSVKLIRNSGTGTGTAVMYYLGHNVVANTLANNNLYFFGNQLTSSLFKQWVSSTVTNSLNLATWQTNTAKDLNSINADPLYTSSTNLIPISTSPVRNTGLVLPWVSTDFNGTPRDATPDIGAFEIVIAASDIAAQTMVSPAQRLLIPGQNYPVSFRFLNTGGSPISSAVLGYSIDNGPAVTIPFNTANPVAPGDSALINFSGLGLTAPTSGTVTLRVWTSAPNGGTDGNPSNDTLTTVYCVGLSGTYVVGNVTGAAFPTPDAALAIINSCGIYGPVTLSIAPGTYPGNRTLGLYTGSTHGITITSQSGVASDVVLTNTGNGNTFALNGASNVTFYGITISNPALPATGAVATSCIDMTGCANITVSNCILKGDPLSTSSLNRAIYISGSNQVNLIGNQISDAYYGIYVSATSPDFSSGYQIAGNQMTNLYYYGIYLNRCQNIQAVANKITGSGTTYYGYYIAGSMGIVFRENELYGNMNFYGYFLSNVSGSASMPNQLINNVVSCNFSATTPRAFYFSTSATDGLDYLEMHHNSFEARVNSTSTTANGLLYFLGGSATAPTMSRLIMQNNIFRLVRAGGTFSATGLYYFAGNWLIDSTVSNYNLLHFEGQGTSPMVRVSATNYTLSAWQTTFAEDLNSLNADPLFNGVNNLTPFGLSPARNAGTPSFVTNDIAGNIRDINPDMGAYEIQMGAADVYVETILNPPAIVQPSTLYPVTARILNASLNPLTSVRLHYQLGNQPEVVQVFPVSLLSGDSLDLTFTQSLTTPASGSLVLTVWSDLPNGISDANPGNDTARTLLCQPLAGGTYTVGQSSGNDFSSFANLFEILSCGGVTGPVTIQLNADNNLLNEQIIIPAIPGLSTSQPLILDGMGDTVTAGNSQASLAVLGFRNTKHIIARNFVIKTLGTASGVIFANSDSCGLISNTILADTTSTSSTVNGIITSGSLNSTSSASLSKGLLIDSNLVQGGYYGLRLYGDAGTYSVGNTVKNNVFSDFYLYGIYTYYQDGALIRNNDISRPYRRTLSTFYGIYNLYFLRGEISANRIHNGFGSNPLGTSTVYGIYISNSPSPANQPNLIFNNLVHNMNNGTGSIYGLYHTASSNTHWYHNTLTFDQAASTSGLVYGAYFLGTGNNNHFKNNLVSITRGGTGTKYCVYYIGTSGMISDNNALHMGSTSGSNGIGFNGTAQATLAAWRNASGGLFDMNSSDADPMFASTITLPLVPTNWPLNNIGENLGNLVPLDLSGQVRALTPDPGAYEFTVNGCFGLLNLRSDNIQAYSARILWASAAAQWDVEYGLAGFAQGSGTSLSLTQSNAVLSGLLPNTAYQVYVRESGCSSGTGSWSTIGFTTRRDYDLSAVDLIDPTNGQCTNASLPVRMVVANTGLLPMNGYTGRVRVSGPTNATITATSTNILVPGQKDTLLVGNLNLFPGRLASFEISVSNPTDFFRFNDTLDIDKEFIGVDAGQDTTITPGDTATLNASIFGFASSSVLNATPGANNGSAGVSFNVRALQTAYIDTIYTNIYGTLGNPATVSLWYLPTAINGAPNISTAGGWTQIHSAYPTTVGNASFSNALANSAIALPAGFNIPAGSTYGFFVTVASGGSTAYKTHVTGSVDTFANSAIVISTGPNVGYGGSAPSPTNHPRQFCGAVSVRNRAVVQWTEQGSSTVLGTGNTLRVAPSLTTTYVATLVDSLCPSSDAVTVFSGSVNEITGLFRYNNTAQTIMTNSIVQLKDPQNVVVMTAPTDATGAYHLLPVAPGSYTLTGTTGKPWGGVNSVDALGISRSFTGAAPLAGLRVKAADVNGSNTVNSLDALTTSRRFSGSVTSFTVGNWAMENLPITFSSGTITRNLLAICYGDVNGSYNPSTAFRQEPKLALVAHGTQAMVQNSSANRWVWSADRDITLGALAVVVTLPEGVKAKTVRSRMNDGSFDFHQNGRELRISWYSLEENHRKAGEALLEMDLLDLPKDGLSALDLAVEPLSEGASPLAEVYDLTSIRMPSLKPNLDFECKIYPNPSQGTGRMSLRLPATGNTLIQIWDGSGRLVAKSNRSWSNPGAQDFDLPLEGLAQGLYRVEVVFVPDALGSNQILRAQVPLQIQP